MVVMHSRIAGLFLLSLAIASPVTVLGQTPGDSRIERGRYIARLGGCNDCHTAGYLLAEGQIPESEWLLGDTFGWRGPWGTTYGSNLRLLMAGLTEQQWLTLAKNLRARPPMPWFTLNELSDDDLRALYAFIRHLGPAGSPAPAYVPPDQEPPPPYASFPSPPPTE
jgi:mono/diheme cytochrome c family protein